MLGLILYIFLINIDNKSSNLLLCNLDIKKINFHLFLLFQNYFFSILIIILSSIPCILTQDPSHLIYGMYFKRFIDKIKINIPEMLANFYRNLFLM